MGLDPYTYICDLPSPTLVIVKSAVVSFPVVDELLIDTVDTVSLDEVAEKTVFPPLLFIEEILTTTGVLEFTKISSIGLTST